VIIGTGLTVTELADCTVLDAERSCLVATKDEVVPQKVEMDLLDAWRHGLTYNGNYVPRAPQLVADLPDRKV
jgi:hypothetical protein